MKNQPAAPSKERPERANITLFTKEVNRRFGTSFVTYLELYERSVAHIRDFWAAVWDFVQIKAWRTYEKGVEDLGIFPGTKWFPGVQINFAENLLPYRDDRDAFIIKSETKPHIRMTYEDLYGMVGRLAGSMKAIGVVKEDGIAAYTPNLMETGIAMLATTALGATFASCRSELGTQAVIDRFSQIEPKVLFAVDVYVYKNKPFTKIPGVKAVVESVPFIERVVIVSYVSDVPDMGGITKAVLYRYFLGREPDLVFEQASFDHLLYIMFSSETTGKPKCMVQSLGGILINQMKEFIEDTIMYMTAPFWMTWSWLMASLAVGSRLALFDGNPGYPDLGVTWRLVEEKKITFFGTSATCLNMLKSRNCASRDRFDPSSLKSMAQAGSSLSADGFEYVYQSVKEDVHLDSLSGGTGINGCFVMGCPVMPVYGGELGGLPWA